MPPAFRCVKPFFVVATACLCTAIRADDWPHWRGPNYDGISPETGLHFKWPDKGPKVLWQKKLAGGYSSTAAAGGFVFTQAYDKAKKEEIVLCFDAARGTLAWEFRYPCDYAPHLEKLDKRFISGPRATPTVDGPHVYTLGLAGDLFCLDKKTGQKVWRRDLLELSERPIGDYGFCSSPLIVGDRLYVHPGGQKDNSLAALDKKTGQLLWKSGNDRIGLATPIHYRFAGQDQLLFFTGEAAVAVTPDAGKLLWRHPWDTEFDLNVATPIFHDGQVFISSNYNKGGCLLKLRPKAAPEVVWANGNMANHFTTCVLFEKHLYGFSNYRLRCVEWETGKIRWEQGDLGRGTLLVADRHLIVMGEYGDLVVANASSKEYDEVARCQPLKGSCWGSPVLADGRLILRNEKTILALDLKK